MLWRVRTTLADRPGALAVLARRCGERSVNILGLQIFPGVEGVTDELVLRSPGGWTVAHVAGLVESAGGTRVSVGACTEHALVDGPIRYLHALRSVLDGAVSREQALARLLDAGVPFTATEHARAAAFTETLDDLVDRGLAPPEGRPAEPAPRPSEAVEVLVREASYADAAGLTAMHARCSHDTVFRHYGAPLARLDLRLARRMLLGEGSALVAAVDGAVVGFATVSPVEDGRAELSLLVEDRWQRRGIGTRLLGAATRQAAESGAEHLVMRGPADSPAAIALVFGSGLRARVRLSGDELVVTIATRGLAAAPEPAPVTGATVTPLRPTPA
jgi:GNAT superfamily N-acetyltransferase